MLINLGSELNYFFSLWTERRGGKKGKKELHTAASDARACLRGKKEMQKLQHKEMGQEG